VEGASGSLPLNCVGNHQPFSTRRAPDVRSDVALRVPTGRSSVQSVMRRVERGEQLEWENCDVEREEQFECGE
jgi:hypothetical protein